MEFHNERAGKLTIKGGGEMLTPQDWEGMYKAQEDDLRTLRRAVREAIKAVGGQTDDAVSNAFLSLLPAEVGAIKHKLTKTCAERDALAGLVVELRGVLEKIRDEAKVVAEGAQSRVRNDFTSGESHGFGLAYVHVAQAVGRALSLPLPAAAERVRARIAELEGERDAAKAKNDVASVGISALIHVYEAADRLAEECDEDTWKVEEVRMRDLHSALERYEEIAENGGEVYSPITQLTAERDNALRYTELLIQERDAAKAEAEDLQALFDLQRKRMTVADELWRKAHPEEGMTWPDLGRLLEWLMQQLALARAGEARAVEALKLIAAMASDELKGETSKGFLLHFCYGVKEIAECSTLDAQPALAWLAQQRREAAEAERNANTDAVRAMGPHFSDFFFGGPGEIAYLQEQLAAACREAAAEALLGLKDSIRGGDVPAACGMALHFDPRRRAARGEGGGDD